MDLTVCETDEGSEWECHLSDFGGEGWVALSDAF